MEEVHYQDTGQDRLLAKEVLLLKEAQRHLALDQFDQAYAKLREIYALGSMEKAVYIGLYQSCLGKCQTQPPYCEEAKEWKKVLDRLSDSEVPKKTP